MKKYLLTALAGLFLLNPSQAVAAEHSLEQKIALHTLKTAVSYTAMANLLDLF